MKRMGLMMARDGDSLANAGQIVVELPDAASAGGISSQMLSDAIEFAVLHASKGLVRVVHWMDVPSAVTRQAPPVHAFRISCSVHPRSRGIRWAVGRMAAMGQGLPCGCPTKTLRSSRAPDWDGRQPNRQQGGGHG